MTNTIKVWDPIVRIFHWALVASMIVVWISAEESAALHEAAGYAILGLIAVRVMWGFIGSKHARFSNFIKGPTDTIAYIGDIAKHREKRHIGHNPAGAAMVVALIAMIAATGFTGWLSEDEARMAMLPPVPQVIGAAIADDDHDKAHESREHHEDSAIKEIHEALANLLLILIALHVAGVVLASVRHKESLVKAMITGKKRAAEPGDIS